jgi:hypothetical protein
VIVGNGVDWKNRVLRVTGAGPPDTRASNPAQARLGAERSAKEAALRSLRALARQVPLRPGRTLGDAMATAEVKGRVEKALGGYRVAHHRYFSDGGVELEVEVPLSALAAAVGEPIEGLGKEGGGK